MKYIITICALLILTNVKAQELNIDSYSYKQYISNNGTIKDYNDSTKVVINKNVLIKGKDKFVVVTIQQSKVSPNKYRIYYLKPTKSGDFEYDLEQADFDERYNELRLKIGLGGIYGLYIK
jgi:hypothetical protein